MNVQTKVAYIFLVVVLGALAIGQYYLALSWKQAFVDEKATPQIELMGVVSDINGRDYILIAGFVQFLNPKEQLKTARQYFRIKTEWMGPGEKLRFYLTDIVAMDMLGPREVRTVELFINENSKRRLILSDANSVYVVIINKSDNSVMLSDEARLITDEFEYREYINGLYGR